jgi:hypothetical protein
MARFDQPWRCSLQTCSSVASHRALRGPHLCLRRRCGRRHRYGGPAIRLDDGCTAQRVAHRFQCLPVGAEDLVERFGKVWQEVKAVGHLDGLRRARASTVDRGVEDDLSR